MMEQREGMLRQWRRKGTMGRLQGAGEGRTLVFGILVYRVHKLKGKDKKKPG